MQSGFLPFSSSSIHYLKWGTGNKLLACFHGYGESASHFNFLGDQLADQFTILAIDLPHHGETSWNSDIADGKQLAAIVQAIIKKENLEMKELHLLGFSLGGRIALSLYEFMHKKVKGLILLAPDGLKMNFWYWLSTQTIIGKITFRLTMRSPGWFFGMLRVGNAVRLINPSIFKFVQYYIHDAKVRKQLYDRWTSMGHCRPDLQNIKKQIQKNNPKIRLLYGRHDRIIIAAPAERFLKGLSNVELEILDCGHQVLHPKNAHHIARAVIS